MSDITLREAQQSVDQWIKTLGIRYFNELTNMAILTEEVGEVARIIARRYGEQRAKIWPMKWLMFCGFCSAWPTKPVWI